MKKLSILLCLLSIFFATTLFAQYDRIWIGGAIGDDFANHFGNCIIHFEDDSIISEPITLKTDMLQSSAVISKGPNQIEFYSNNCQVFNRKHEIMEGGDSLWFPSEHNTNWSCSNQMGTAILDRGIVALPVPDSDSKYTLIYARYDTLTGQNEFPTTLLYSEIDMSKNNGLGKVISTRNILLQDTFTENIDVVRHGNGRDWWVFIPKMGTDSIWTFLLTPTGIKGPMVRITPLRFIAFGKYLARPASKFSQDGTYYCQGDYWNKVHLFKFDRCTGTFSCPMKLDLADSTAFIAGVSFSPNNRFLYASTFTKVYQFDLWSENINQSRVLVGEYDGYTFFNPPISTTFYMHQLAPNGKIYINGANGIAFLHVINNPNEKGKACNFVQRGLELPTYFGFSIPYYPNYNLYDFEGSPCDTLGINKSDTLRHYIAPINYYLLPNPANESFELLLPENCSDGIITVYSSTGQRMIRQENLKNALSHVFDVRSWAQGIYFVEFIGNGNERFLGKLVVVR